MKNGNNIYVANVAFGENPFIEGITDAGGIFSPIKIQPEELSTEESGPEETRKILVSIYKHPRRFPKMNMATFKP